MNAICLILWAGIPTWHAVANLAILLWNKNILLLCWGMLRSSSLLQCATNKDGAVTVTWYSGQASKQASNSTQHDTGHLFQAHTGLVTQNGKTSSWTRRGGVLEHLLESWAAEWLCKPFQLLGSSNFWPFKSKSRIHKSQLSLAILHIMCIDRQCQWLCTAVPLMKPDAKVSVSNICRKSKRKLRTFLLKRYKLNIIDHR